jgi:chromosome segregation ATPase
MLAENHKAEMKKVHHEKQQLMTSLQQIKDCKDNAEANLTAMKEKLNQRCLEANELCHQLKACQKQLTQSILVVVDECARRDNLKKAHSDLESRFVKVSTVFLLLFNIKFSNLI